MTNINWHINKFQKLQENKQIQYYKQCMVSNEGELSQ